MHGAARPPRGPTMADCRRGRWWLPLLAGAWLLPSAFACRARPGTEVLPPSDGGAGAGGTVPVARPGRKDMHRLNSAEYNATVQDVLGTTLQPANATWRGGEIEGFDNIATQSRHRRHPVPALLQCRRGARRRGLRVRRRSSGRFVTCATLDDAACVQGIIEQRGLAPLPPTARPRKRSAPTKASTQAARDARRRPRLLRSSWCCARCSPAPSSCTASSSIPTRAPTQPHPLDAYELASRLSYFLWSSAPDDALARGRGGRLAARPTPGSPPPSIACWPTPKSERLVDELRRPVAGRARGA